MKQIIKRLSGMLSIILFICLMPICNHTFINNAQGTIGRPPENTLTDWKLQLRLLRKQQRIWNSRSISSYQFDFRWICFCTSQYRRAVVITVRANKIAEIHYKDNSKLVAARDYSRYPTIAALFELLRDTIEEPVSNLSVTYDADIGCPLKGWIDYSAKEVDDEMGFKVNNIIILD